MKTRLLLILTLIALFSCCKKDPVKKYIGSYMCLGSEHRLDLCSGTQQLCWRVAVSDGHSVQVDIKETKSVFFMIEVENKLFMVDSVHDNIYYFHTGSVEFDASGSSIYLVVNESAAQYFTYEGSKVSN